MNKVLSTRVKELDVSQDLNRLKEGFNNRSGIDSLIDAAAI